MLLSGFYYRIYMKLFKYLYFFKRDREREMNEIVISGHFEALLSTRPHDLRLASS